MKIKAIIVSALILCCLSAAIMYTTAAQSKNESKMITEAIQGKNTPQLIKALISRMKEQLDVNEDDFPELIKEVENYAAECKDPTSTAVLHSMIAEMYNHYYTMNRWKISQRTDLAGYAPEDIREWTSNLFTQKIKEELTASLEPAKLLQDTPVSAFDAILETGKDTPVLRPTLYDFLAFRALDIAPSADIYKELITYLNAQPDRKAAMLANLDYLRFQYTSRYSEKAREEYSASLDSLLAIYGNKDYSVEIVEAKLNSGLFGFTAGINMDSVRTIEYKLCKETIARFPNYERIGLIKNRLADMQNPILQVNTANTVYPGKDLTLKLNFRNIPQITARIYKSLKTPQQTLFYNDRDTANKPGALVKEVTFSLTAPNTYTQLDTSLVIPMDQIGLYECIITVPESNIKTNNLFEVSRLASISRNMQNGNTEVLVTDYLSGKPITDATVTYYSGKRREMQQQGTVKTDKDGIAVFSRKGDLMAYRVSRQGDAQTMLTIVYPNGERQVNRTIRPQLALFTDRGLYRPGQTLYFKGIAYTNETSKPHALEGETFKVILRDANWKEVATKEFKTNKFGSFNGEFTLPQQTLNGTFTLSTDYASTNIRVEEYKRPTFQVNILPVKDEISFGDLVTIRGKAETFSGVSLQSGEVTYRITKQPLLLRGYFPINNSYEQVAEGRTTVNSDGTFSFDFRPEESGNYQPYLISVTLTDSNGETQEASSTITVGKTSIILTTNIQGEFDKDSADVVISAQTLNREQVTLDGTYTINKLQDENKETYSDYEFVDYKVGKQVTSGNFTSGKQIDRDVFRKLESGRYRIKIEAKDSKGRPATTEQDFILYSLRDKKPPVFKHVWLLNEKTSCLPGEEAKILFGTSDKDVHVLYELFRNGQCLSRKYVVLSNENHLFRIPFNESYGDGIVATFTFIKKGKLYRTQSEIKRQQPDLRLTIKPITFRDRLLPGNRETWKFRILDTDSVPAMAEMLASMYDASLDKILPYGTFKWNFDPQRSVYLNAPAFNNGISLDDKSSYKSGEPDFISVPDYQYDRLDWQGVLSYRQQRAYGSGIMMKSAAAPMAAEAQVVGYRSNDAASITGNANIVDDEVEESGEMLFSLSDAAWDKAEAKPVQAQPQLPVRENFNETAFFYPSLLTNEEGDVMVQFTLPESNTTWKFQALANTVDMKYGLLTKEVISSKPLMVVPNLPRFMRQGDEVSVSTQVINNSKASISGRVSLELFDPATDQPVICLTKSQRPFTLSADSITTASWTFRVPETTNLIGCRIVADSESGSDGEQHLIPVLSNQILVTESTPFYLMENGEKQIRLSGSKATGSRNPFRMTLELTGNPIWYAVQALPTLTQPANDNIISWFASYYSNTLANYIATANPRIQKVISQWKAQGGTASTLYSNLQKNQELKNILLEETPWVLAAENETEQKQRLSLLFDMNRAAQQREVALQQLLKLQNEDGGWSWFKGFPASREITLSILKGMSQLVEMSAVQYGQQEKEMQMKALKYLDKQMQSDYESLQKNNKKWQSSVPNALQLEFLYVRSSYRDIPELGDAREAIRFYTAQAEKTWNEQSLYGKGEIALLMYRNGKKEVANTILAWLRKTATTTTEQGMYWANNRRGNNYFISPIETHCLLMKVFNTLSPDSKDTDRMKQWLLNQKRTQNWESVPATLNAIYALVLTGSDWLNDNNTCTVTWGDKTYSTAEGETATGYLKVVLDEKEISSERNSISIRKEGNAPTWGAVYEQYFENIDKVEKQTGVLNVEKKLFIESNSGSGLQITPVENGKLQPGDKVVVRLTIRTDREMDYVFLKDLRAGCFEPASQISGTKFRDGVAYYQSPTDVSENFFFNRLPAGTFVIEYPVYVSRTGEYAGGISTIQCLYAPEFISHTEGETLTVY
ncbi:alpha-2-macroglobulin family protein [Parabacteroides faecis]|uniref:alpha-2-macroglobulin family protein n=1 Tax=Parabacteroides faecis TaxID=1217282 RepID=UPI00352153C6